MNTKEVIELLKKLKNVEVVDFDITLNVEEADINEIARFCGKEGIEFWVYEVTKQINRKLIRIRD